MADLIQNLFSFNFFWIRLLKHNDVIFAIGVMVRVLIEYAVIALIFYVKNSYNIIKNFKLCKYLNLNIFFSFAIWILFLNKLSNNGRL